MGYYVTESTDEQSTVMKIYSDRRYLLAGQGHVVMLFPFWGKNPEDPGDPTSGRFDEYLQLGSNFFNMSSLQGAQVAVFPGTWEWTTANQEAVGLAERFAEAARREGKPVVIFFWSDSTEEVPIENSVIFRTSLYCSRKKPNEFAMPAWSEDFVKKYLGSQLPLRHKRDKPVVGFCGYAGPILKAPLRQRVKHVLLEGAQLLGLRPRRKKHGAPIRARALRALSKSSLVETNFVLRDRFWGGAVSSDNEDLERMQRLRREYVQNMVESDYILCTRGGGNFSYRLYETLSCGRIPIFINTDCVLPYQSEIDWKRYCVWLDEKDIEGIAESVAEFHSALSPEDFIDLQRECRKLWEDWLCPVGFFTNFHKHFKRLPFSASKQQHSARMVQREAVMRIRFKHSLGLLHRLIRPIIDPYRLIVSIARHGEYFRDLLRYSRLEGSEPIKVANLHPCLHEKTSTSSFDQHYFYLDLWAAQRIMKSGTALHVDVGSRVDFVGFLTCFTKIISIDIRPLEACVDNLESLAGSVLAMPFEDCTVQSLCCLHVAEHIGLGRYGDPLDPYGTEKTARELSRVLAVGGNLFFAVPVGKPRLCFNAHRIHSTHQILEYFHDLDLIEFSGVDDTAVYHENLAIDALNNSNYACGFFWFKKRSKQNSPSGIYPVQREKP